MRQRWSCSMNMYIYICIYIYIYVCVCVFVCACVCIHVHTDSCSTFYMTYGLDCRMFQFDDQTLGFNQETLKISQWSTGLTSSLPSMDWFSWENLETMFFLTIKSRAFRLICFFHHPLPCHNASQASAQTHQERVSTGAPSSGLADQRQIWTHDAERKGWGF